MSTRESSGPDDKRRILGTCLILATAVFLLFGQLLRCDFVNYDDNEYFTSNPRVLAGLTPAGATWAFRETHSNNWHPLTWLSLMLDVELFGPGPGGAHFTNVLLHASNTALLFLLLRRMTGAHWRSALVAALFGLHPLHVESVAWVSERKDVLSLCFGLLALLAYAQYGGQRSGVRWQADGVDQAEAATRNPQPATRYYWLSLLCFALGLMSKPMLVTLPFVMLLLDYWPLHRGAPGPRVREKLPFIVLSAASCCITLAAQSGAIQPLDRISLGVRSVNAVLAYARYLGSTVWPVNLAVHYPHGYRSFWWFCLAAGVLLAITLGVFRARRRAPFLATGWFWYLGTLVPVIGLVQVGTQSMADRYTYLPLIGIFIMAAWGGAALVERLKLPPAAGAGLAVVVLGACAARTADQLLVWRNSETLFRHALAVTRGNYIAHYNLGEHCFRQGNIKDSISHYSQAIGIFPAYDDALNNLGVALATNGELAPAAARLREAIRCRPGRADAHFNLGNVLVMQHQLDEAAAAYSEALRLKPDYPEAHNNLANVLVMEGRRDEAARHYRETLRLNPGHAGARRQLQTLELTPAE